MEKMWWGNELCPRLFPRGAGDLVAIYSRSKEESVFFAKYILRRTDAELATLEGETVSEWETKVGNSSELFILW